MERQSFTVVYWEKLLVLKNVYESIKVISLLHTRESSVHMRNYAETSS